MRWQLHPFCYCCGRAGGYAWGRLPILNLFALKHNSQQRNSKARIHQQYLFLGTFVSSKLCPHRSDHLRNRCGVGCAGRAGSHRHSPRQGPFLLCWRVWQPVQICPQGHPEHLYRVQLAASELNSEQVKRPQMLLSQPALGQPPMLYGAVEHAGLGQWMCCDYFLPVWFFMLWNLEWERWSETYRMRQNDPSFWGCWGFTFDDCFQNKCSE